VVDCPTATPMRRKPKSKLSTYPCGIMESGTPAFQVQAVHLDAQTAQGLIEAIR